MNYCTTFKPHLLVEAWYGHAGCIMMTQHRRQVDKHEVYDPMLRVMQCSSMQLSVRTGVKSNSTRKGRVYRELVMGGGQNVTWNQEKISTFLIINT